MFCPQCATESIPNQQYCRTCGANLKMIGKAVTLSETIARSDRGPLPKIKEMIKNLKVEHITDDVGRAIEQMNQEIVRNISNAKTKGQLDRQQRDERRRENHIVHGASAMFFGVALMIVLYFLSSVLVLKIPPEALAKIPFELEPVVRTAWIIGLIPAMSGFARILAGLYVRSGRCAPEITAPEPEEVQLPAAETSALPPTPVPRNSVTENTTEFFKVANK
jgi:hypothetical protein